MTSKANLLQPAYNATNWNTPLNGNFQTLTDALGSAISIAITTSDVILTTAQASNLILNVSGTMTAARTLFLPASIAGQWLVYNTATAFDLTIASDNGAGAPAGTAITLLSGQSYEIYSDGTNVRYGTSNIVQKTGDTMTGALILPAAAPTLANQAANKSYVDTKVAQTTAVNTGSGLAGGGALSSSLTLSVANGGITPPMLSGAQSGSAPAFAVRAWGTIAVVGSTPSVTAGGNTASVSLVSAGIFNVVFTTAMADANYAVIATSNNALSKPDYLVVASKSTAGFSIYNFTGGSTPALNSGPFSFMVIR